MAMQSLLTPNSIGRRTTAFSIALAILASASIAALGQTESHPAALDDLIAPYLSSDSNRAAERAVVAQARESKLPAGELAEASLIVEGREAAAWIARLRERLEAWNRELGGEVASQPAREKAEQILRFLHRRALTGGYEAETSSLVATLNEGRYNCVSASLLFLALAERKGLTVAGVQRPGHVFCRVQIESGEWLDVETTCAKCGVPAHREPVAGVRQVAPAEFLAKCYYNLGVAHLQRHRFEDAVACCALAWQLDPQDDRARDNLLASLNNGALQRCEIGDFSGAESLLGRARRISANYGPLVANEAYLARLRVARYCSEERFAEAKAVVAELKSRRPESAAATALDAQIRRQLAGRDFVLPGADSGNASPEVRSNSPSGDLTLPGF